MAKLGQKFERHRPLIGKLLFEIVIIFIGVTAAFALEAARQDRQDNAYRKSMIAALIPTLDDLTRHNRQFERDVDLRIATFDADLAAGRHPLLPVYREPGGERPPTRAWEGIVATGVSKALPPSVYYNLSLFYTRQESFGERYVRYAEMTEREVLPLGPRQLGIYEPDGALKPRFAAYVDRIRDLSALAKRLDPQADELKGQLAALD